MIALRRKGDDRLYKGSIPEEVSLKKDPKEGGGS